MNAYLLAESEKQVLTFNLMIRGQRAEGLNRTEERLMLEKALFDDERRQIECAPPSPSASSRRPRSRTRRTQAAQPPTPSWQHALAATACGQASFSGQLIAPAVLMQQQQQQEMTMTAGACQPLAASRREGCSGEQALMQAVIAATSTATATTTIAATAARSR
jgi:hypothetical protein